MSSKEGLGLPAKIPSNKDYENLVDLNYQLYNGLFLTLPLDEIEQTGMLLPLLEARAHGVGVVLSALAEEGEGSLVDGNFLLDAHRADRD